MTTIQPPLGQPIGTPLPDWTPCPSPPKTSIDGHFCRIEPIDPNRHTVDLFRAFSLDQEDRIWTYLPYGPFDTEADLETWIKASCLGDDPVFHAIIDKQTGAAVGVASYLRIDPACGVIEVGHINYSPLLQRTPAATEAMFLLMRRVFSELGYRRYEWKCDALNAGSKRSAERLGFHYDGLFEQATIYKNRNRDTAWFSILDKNWPAIEIAYESWLNVDNFDPDGKQKQSLGALIQRARSGSDN